MSSSRKQRIPVKRLRMSDSHHHHQDNYDDAANDTNNNAANTDDAPMVEPIIYEESGVINESRTQQTLAPVTCEICKQIFSDSYHLNRHKFDSLSCRLQLVRNSIIPVSSANDQQRSLLPIYSDDVFRDCLLRIGVGALSAQPQYVSDSYLTPEAQAFYTTLRLVAIAMANGAVNSSFGPVGGEPNGSSEGIVIENGTNSPGTCNACGARLPERSSRIVVEDNNPAAALNQLFNQPPPPPPPPPPTSQPTPIRLAAATPTTGRSGTTPANSNRPRNKSLAQTRVNCPVCEKELCNKYFLRTHLIKAHNMSEEDASDAVARIVPVRQSIPAPNEDELHHHPPTTNNPTNPSPPPAAIATLREAALLSYPSFYQQSSSSTTIAQTNHNITNYLTTNTDTTQQQQPPQQQQPEAQNGSSNEETTTTTALDENESGGREHKRTNKQPANTTTTQPQNDGHLQHHHH